MKATTRIKWTILFLCLLEMQSFDAWCQFDTIFAPPQGYTNFQLRNKNVLKVDPSGNIWVGFKHIGAGVFNGTGWTVYDRTNSGLPGNNVTALAFDGSISWIGTDSGLVQFAGTNWLLYDSSNSGLSRNYVKLLYFHNGNLWIAFESGLQRFDGVSWYDYSISNGLANDTVTCFGSTSNAMFIGTANGISEYRNGSWTQSNLGASGTDSNYIASIVSNSLDTLFVSPSQGGLYIKTGSVFQPAINLLPKFCAQVEYGPVKLIQSVNGAIVARDYNQSFLYQISSQLELKNFSFPWGGSELCDIDTGGRLWEVNEWFFHYLQMVDLDPWPMPPLLPAGRAVLNINEVNAELHVKGDLFWDGIGSAKYVVPQSGCGKTAIFSQCIWMGGLDNNNQLHVAAQTYRQSGEDFWPGPLDTALCVSDSVSSALFNTIWVVERWKILDFITNFNNGNVGSGIYAVPNEILNWPGNGTGNFARQLAPYVDANSDGIYNPYDGDYPSIKGDQMAWWVMNDTLASHGETGGAALGTEIQVSAYAYFCPLVPDSEQVINYTTFYSYKIINRSPVNYHNMYMGLYTDVDLGLFTDDFVGCHVTEDFAYGYNGDSHDEGPYGYGVYPPVINVAILNGPEADALDMIDNNHNGTIDEPGENCMMNHFRFYDGDFTDFGNPENAQDYYYYMAGDWKNDAPMTYGGNGHSGSDSCKYMFPGDSDPTGIGTYGVILPPWDEYTASNMPADRRFLQASGPFTFAAGEVTALDYAIVYTHEPNPVTYPQSSLTHNLAEVKRVKRWWKNDVFPSACALTIGIPEIPSVINGSLKVFPNPAKDALTIQTISIPVETIEIFDVLGQVVFRKSWIIKTTQPVSLDISGLSHGLYLVKASGGNSAAHAKFIKD